MERPNGDGTPAPDAPEMLIDQAVLRLRRIWAKPRLHRELQAQLDTGERLYLSHVLVIHAVGRALDAGAEEVTVGAVAERLDVDPSTASRLVADSIEAGYVVRRASTVDARRAPLELSAAGRRVMAATQRHRTRYFGRLMRDWTEHERSEFARLLSRFAAAAIASPPDITRPDETETDAERPG
ncbi:MarR family winged helix-turn-helix transcriptional regulator [Allonocardiopsis opalescens]|uniref:DNA-binding MarR family transcriptional regulator n=1 Tax=Allonocardiopsis opalescens TaxID=1144618 RepID=A0A2T0QA44_9ACTN|nr:MarR family winged helix-turn-helix transcriptional regulator [Allonocardiopsis opalescens]PRY00690.1 DNA-binding MarR family transcriptional regulator [Allonocardiopsis opalescens]